MRALTGQEEAVLAAPGGYAVRCRVQVKDAADVWHDLTALEGHDWLEGVEYGEDLDQPVSAATVNLRRDVDMLSLSPLRTDSKLNLLTGTYAPLISEGAEFIIETATLPLDVEPVSGDWREVFRGDIDEVDAAGDVLTFSGRDLGGRLQDLFIEEAEVTYSSPSGEAVEDVMQEILDDNGAGVTLYTPSSPGWNITGFTQARVPVLDALRALAQQIGWDLRYRWSSGTSQFELTFFEPDRAKTTPDFTWSASAYEEVSAVRSSRVDVRNYVEVVYSDKADLDFSGVPKRKTVFAEDTASQTRYGYRWMEIQEADSSNIDTATEAQAMADAALADLKEPLLEKTFATPYFYATEIGDLLRLLSNDVHYNADQDLAVVSAKHSISGGEAKSTFSVRGKPSLGPTTWLRMDSRLSTGAPFAGPEAPSGVTATTVVNGFAVSFSPPTQGPKPESYELHVSTSAAFTPSDSTLKATSKSDRFEVADLRAGTTYYAKIVPRDAAGNRGTASSETTLATRYVEPRALQPRTSFHIVPPNGDFEAVNESGSRPDRWGEGLTFAGGTAFSTVTDSYTGANAVQIDRVSIDRTLPSELFVIEPGELYVFEGWAKRTAGSGVGEIVLTWYESDGATSVSTVTANNGSGWTTGVWTRLVNAGVAPSTARFATLALVVKTANATFVFDGAFAHKNVSAQQPWQSVTFVNSWVNFGGTRGNVGYRREGPNLVRLRGAMKDGTIGPAAFQLPAGFRPTHLVSFAVMSANAAITDAVVEVQTNGDVVVTAGDNDLITLDGIAFPLS